MLSFLGAQNAIREKSERVIKLLTEQQQTLALAESCTGGMLAAALTAVPGSSAVLQRGYVTYSNQAKMDDLHVPEALLIQHGAVSTAVAEAMAKGALHKAKSDAAVSITGIAGPTGGTPQKPVGQVHITLAFKDGTLFSAVFFFKGTREKIRQQATEKALDALLRQKL
jgi:PncC family amidohydrolase